MKTKPRDYETEGIAVTYDLAICIHAAECTRGLPAVFDTAKRPWIQPEHGEPGAIAKVIERCPSGALTYRRTDGGAQEQIPEGIAVTTVTDGPLHVRGEVEVRDAEGGLIRRQGRMALCRCGASDNKPFCDNSHIESGFRAP